jgi:hypothetical protein
VPATNLQSAAEVPVTVFNPTPGDDAPSAVTLTMIAGGSSAPIAVGPGGAPAPGEEHGD